MIENREVYSLEEIKKLHKDIFFEEFPKNEFRKKESSKKLKNFVFYKEKTPIGYTIIFDKKKDLTYHLWIGGIIPEFQKKGYYSEILDVFNEMVKEKEYRAITVCSYNHRPHMMRLLIKKGYKITGITEGKYGDQLKIIFKHNVNNKKEIRIGLTNACNFKCFFCHGEGFNSPKAIFLEEEKLKKILNQAYENGFRQITLTGGEPLLNRNGISTTIEHCNKMDEYPILKIITNGSLIDVKFIETLKKYKGNISLNLSLHSVDEEDFDVVTSSIGQLNKIIENIKLLKKNEIDFRVNCVFGKSEIGISDTERIQKFLNTCMELGVEEVTFLEMLVYKNNVELGKRYISFENISKLLKEINNSKEYFQILKKSEKKETYLLKEKKGSLKINVFRLTCQRGCETCLDSKDMMIGADGCYYPCMLSEIKYKDVSCDMKGAFIEGEKLIRSNIKKFSGKKLFF